MNAHCIKMDSFVVREWGISVCVCVCVCVCAEYCVRWDGCGERRMG